MKMSSLIDLSRGYFLAEHIVTMEDSMLQSLKWYVHPPTSFAFCRDLMRLVSGDITPRARHDVTELARFLTELSVCDYWFVTKKPSSVALAAIINALELQGPRRVDPRYKVEFLHRVVDIGMDIANDEEIIECYERLREMYIAGGYTPTLEEPAENNSSSSNANDSSTTRVATVSPTGVQDGPDAEDLNDDDLSQMECV
jgi:lipoyl(octanoyl) transferase